MSGPALALSLALPALLALAAPARARRAEAAAAPATVRYQLGLLYRGAAWTPERAPRTDSLQAGHMANIVRMASLGALVAAGPFEEDQELRGLFVFAPEAGGIDTLLADDPAIAAGRLDCRLATWVAPPGLGEEYRRRAAARGARDAPDSMVSFAWVMLHRGARYDSRPTPAVEKLLERHHAYTERLRADGQLVFAGAIEGTGDLRGVLVIQGDSADVMRAVREDPAVRAGRFSPRILHWWTAWGTIPGH